MTRHLATAGAVLVSASLWITAQAWAQVGYTVLTANDGNGTPMGSALFGFWCR